MQTEQELRLVVADLFDQLVNDHVIYAEIRFAPHLHTEKGLTLEQVVEVVDSAVSQESARAGIEARLILCTLRHFTAEQSLETVHLVRRFRGRRVVALDIAGDEAGYPIDAHLHAFQFAVANDICRTAHAGEARGAESVWETLKYLRPTRIGHGVRSLEDRSLLDHLNRTRVHLEICLTSNVQTNVIPTPGAHPVQRLYDSGVSLGINTDARSISNVTLGGEYEMLHRHFGWGINHFRQCNLNAIEAAFVPVALRTNIAARLLDEYKAFA